MEKVPIRSNGSTQHIHTGKYILTAIEQRKLTELHTHLMGMGSADFWVTRIMQTYIPTKLKLGKRSCEPHYSLDSMLTSTFGVDAAVLTPGSWRREVFISKSFSTKIGVYLIRT